MNTEQRRQMMNLLHTGKVLVDFHKKDGSVRMMEATLMERYLPKREENENNSPKKEKNPDVCVVWDLEKEAFRSFRWDSVIRFHEKVEE